MNGKKKPESRFHQPVLVDETLAHLQIESGKRYIDATVGGGGHAIEIVRRGGLVLGLDTDPEAVAFSRKRLVLACPPSASSWKVVQANFAHLQDICQEHGWVNVAGILFDLGVSSHQLDSLSRGFSFESQRLDMRLDPQLAVTAADLVNGLGVKELAAVFQRFGEETRAHQYAKAIAEARKQQRIDSGQVLAQIIASVSPRQRGKRHPATRVFQALRIAVNDELGNLKAALPQALEVLAVGGRLVVISFHSLEDRLVKEAFRDFATAGRARYGTVKPIVPAPAEVIRNPRSRSAKLRSIVKE